MRKVWLRALVAGACLAMVVVTTPSARAQADDAQRAAARGFATDGLTAFNAARYDQAIDLFTRAEALVHAPPHLLYIARASAKTGKLVRAKELYVKIAREELAPSAPKAFVDAQASAAAEQAELEPRIPKLTITLAGPGAEGASVTMDGVDVPRALIGVAQPADPGVHKLHAIANGWKAADAEVDLVEGGAGTATLTLDQPGTTSEPAPVSTDEPSTLRRISPFIAFGVGAIGIAVGTVFLLKNHGDRDEADRLCPDGRCPLSRQGQIEELDKSANQAQTLSWIGYGVGAAGVAAGALLVILNRSSTPSKPATGFTMTPWVSAGSAGVTGRF
ncbi:MAG: hypothetical protein KIT84_06545 [Labilithrix sp.]|nr:hypothetical protein [Labilithrix sp.]MCW5810651.1 hypothetical protein [Labilithrix sp.]